MKIVFESVVFIDRSSMPVSAVAARLVRRQAIDAQIQTDRPSQYPRIAVGG